MYTHIAKPPDKMLKEQLGFCLHAIMKPTPTAFLISCQHLHYSQGPGGMRIHHWQVWKPALQSL